MQIITQFIWFFVQQKLCIVINISRNLEMIQNGKRFWSVSQSLRSLCWQHFDSTVKRKFFSAHVFQGKQAACETELVFGL